MPDARDSEAGRLLRQAVHEARGVVSDRLDDLAGRRRPLAPKLERLVADVRGNGVPMDRIRCVLRWWLDELLATDPLCAPSPA